ncbi:HA1F protein, partial [Pluvianellus socialis]|nr:HA1F protein [Pluvianellus socialis]
SPRYFHIAMSEPSPGVPEFVSMGYVDGNLITRYNSEMRRADWMAANLDQPYWDGAAEL